MTARDYVLKAEANLCQALKDALDAGNVATVQALVPVWAAVMALIPMDPLSEAERTLARRGRKYDTIRSMRARLPDVPLQELVRVYEAFVKTSAQTRLFSEGETP